MIAYLYKKTNNEVVSVINDLQHITTDSVIGESDYSKGVNFDYIGVLSLEDAITNIIDEEVVEIQSGHILNLDGYTDLSPRMKIIGRLLELDSIIDRRTEQIYIDTNSLPSYQPMLDAMIEKASLRQQLQESEV